jgi:hypothetical protein
MACRLLVKKEASLDGFLELADAGFHLSEWPANMLLYIVLETS